MTTVDHPQSVQIPREIAETIMHDAPHADDAKVYQAYAWLRENAPLARADIDGYDPVYLVSRYADLMEIELNPEAFSSGGGPHDKGGANPLLVTQAGDDFTRSLTGGSLRILDALTYLDPPEHTDLRKIANDWFRPANLKKWEQQIRDLAIAAVDRLESVSDGGEIDLLANLTLNYPLRVVMTLFGVPVTDESRMMTLTQELFGATDPDAARDDVDMTTPEAAAEQFAAAIADFYGYFGAMLQDRRANPRDDLATLIAVAKQGNGEYWPDTFVYGYYITIATAGHDTTSSTLTAALHALGHNPQLLRRVQGDLKLIPGLINETLRWVSPVKHFMRRAEKRVTVAGVDFEPGDRLMLLYQSANRDENAFENADTFSIDRTPNRQIALGYGPHMCLGQHLARMEMRILLEELLPRIKELEILREPRMVQTNFIGGMKELPSRILF